LSKIRRKGLLLASMCVLVWGTAKAQRSNRAGGKTKDRLKLVLILSRHGVRSPTWTQERLDGYSAQPWPKWSVPPGDLTSRGYQLIGQFGSFDRATLAAQGLFAASGCADAANIYLWADSDQRTVATGHAIAEGLFPGCSPPLHGLAAGEIDPLFHPTAGGVKPAQADAAFAEFARLAERPHAAQQDELLEEMRQVLSGCTPGRSCLPVRMPAVSLLGTPSAGVRGKGDHIVDLRGPMAQASSFAEDFLLEYADGMPMDQVGWGHVNEAQLRRFLALHSAYFALMHRTFCCISRARCSRRSCSSRTPTRSDLRPASSWCWRDTIPTSRQWLRYWVCIGRSTAATTTRPPVPNWRLNFGRMIMAPIRFA